MQSEILPQMLKSTPSSGEGIQILPQELKYQQKGYKYELYPNKEQKEYLEKIFGSCRRVYNDLLAIQIEKHKEAVANGTKPTFPSLQNLSAILTSLKAANQWLYEVPSVALQQAARRLEVAYKNFFRGLKVHKAKRKQRFPKFKSKKGYQSFTLMTNAFSIKDGYLYIAKCPTPIKVNWSRSLPSTPTSLTIKKSPSGRYTVSFVYVAPPRVTSGKKIVGIDVGLKSLITTSDGEKYDNPKWLKSSLNKLRRLQKALRRKQKDSHNYHKARIALAKLHEHISNQRHDWQHKITRKLVDESQAICIEDLRSSFMFRNRRLARTAADASLASLLHKLQYKAIEATGCNIITAYMHYPSSHICSNTGLKLDRKLELKERAWECPYCSEIHDRDVNAALNLRNYGYNILLTSGLLNTKFFGVIFGRAENLEKEIL